MVDGKYDCGRPARSRLFGINTTSAVLFCFLLLLKPSHQSHSTTTDSSCSKYAGPSLPVAFSQPKSGAANVTTTCCLSSVSAAVSPTAPVDQVEEHLVNETKISHPNKSQKKNKKKEDQGESETTIKTKMSTSFTNKKKSDTVRRIQREWKDLIQNGMAYDWAENRPLNAPMSTASHIWLGPLHRRNLLIWHFSFVGMTGSVYQNGIYHGRIVLPSNYPAAPPKSISVWTPSGRFVCRQPVCLSASQYHPETWQASHWTLQSLVEALRLHMLTTGHEIGGISTCPAAQRRTYALQSQSWHEILATKKSSSSSMERSRSVIYVDHAEMVQRGLFPLVHDDEKTDAFGQDYDKNEKEDKHNMDPLDARLERYLESRQDCEDDDDDADLVTMTSVKRAGCPILCWIRRLIQNRLRLVLWGLFVFFLMLN